MYHSVPLNGAGFHYYPCGIRRYPSELLPVMYYYSLDPAAVVKRILPRKIYFETTVAYLVHAVFSRVPVAEITCQIHFLCAGCPLSVIPARTLFMEAEIFVAVGKIDKVATLSHKRSSYISVIVHTKVQIALKRSQVRIVINNLITQFNYPRSIKYSIIIIV